MHIVLGCSVHTATNSTPSRDLHLQRLNLAIFLLASPSVSSYLRRICVPPDSLCCVAILSCSAVSVIRSMLSLAFVQSLVSPNMLDVQNYLHVPLLTYCYSPQVFALAATRFPLYVFDPVWVSHALNGAADWHSAMSFYELADGDLCSEPTTSTNINTLPNELIRLILTVLAEFSTNAPRDHIDATIAASQVCRTWRTISISTPSIWRGV